VEAALRVVVFTGLPGTGKSTLAELTAKALGAPAFAGDWLMGALKPAARALAQVDRETYVELDRSLLRSLITRQLMLQQSAVVDSILPDVVLSDWRELAEGYGASMYVVECVCTDESVHRARVEGRVRGIPGWHEVGWDHVERMRTEIPPVQIDHLTLDAMDSLASNFDAVRSLLKTGPPRA
jgi:adenylate kinase family enzyme